MWIFMKSVKKNAAIVNMELFLQQSFHTLKVFVYIFLISLVLNIIIGLVGEETLAGLFYRNTDCR